MSLFLLKRDAFYSLTNVTVTRYGKYMGLNIMVLGWPELNRDELSHNDLHHFYGVSMLTCM
jgi:hypothetical protein